MRLSILLVVWFVSAQAFSTPENPCKENLLAAPTLADEVEKMLDHAGASSAYFIRSDLVHQMSAQLNVSTDEIYFALSLHAAKKGLQPISHFPVGAAGVTESGDVILGANIEFEGTHLGQSFHAERTVIALANESGSRMRALFSSVTPCGGCRQWLNEINGGSNIKIVSKGKDGFYQTELRDLLPHDFGPHHLGQTGILDGNLARWQVDNKMVLHESVLRFGHRNADAVEQELTESLERSYAPYSNEPSAAVIVLRNGEIYSGSYIEQAAYESYPALSVALAKMTMSGLTDYSQISHVIVASATMDPHKNLSVDHRSSNTEIGMSNAIRLEPAQIDFIPNIIVTRK